MPVPSLPATHYAKSGDVHIAYQVSGEGPLDVVVVPGFVSHVEYQWEEPWGTRFFQRLASFSRLIRFDKRGTGLSDGVSEMRNQSYARREQHGCSVEHAGKRRW